MNNKLIIGIAALLLAAPASMAADYYRVSSGPDTVNVAALAGLGIRLCDDGVLGQTVPALLCGTGGFGTIIPLDGSAGEADLNPAVAASGSCKVRQLDGNGEFSFSCGVDRDDDTFVTNLDPTSTDARGYDDDFSDSDAIASGDQGSVNVCFREDLDGAFDDAEVFIAMNVPSTSAPVGTFCIELSLTATTGC
jgi:hypothetical protein